MEETLVRLKTESEIIQQCSYEIIQLECEKKKLYDEYFDKIAEINTKITKLQKRISNSNATSTSI